ncbi:MAG: HD domain-containing protein [Candidatus Aenigmarchaeota archaeon]|nr:HD domain-containing protein [Candidatus Aenigmarchaeota archaeon]
MNQELIVRRTAEYARKRMEDEASGHDWWHAWRVWKTAVRIAKKEGADLFVVQLAALLHDIADWKFNDGDVSIVEKDVRKLLEKLCVEEHVTSHVCEIIGNVSFRGAGVKARMRTKEGMIVQDADRLDAIGAIGIARAFAYGGFKGKEIYNPNILPGKHKTFEEYKNAESTTINHFYEKLLLLKDLMNTETGKEIAEERHRFMENFLEEFFEEWEGRRYLQQQ